jgi:ABC-2 type transport system permease protein
VRRIRFIAQKEIYHILRDPRSLTIAFALPILMTFLYGYAINMDIETIVLATSDMDRTAESRELVSQFYQSTYFTPSERPVDLADPEQLLRSGAAGAVLIIRPGFAEALRRGERFELGMTVDGADATLANAVQSYSKIAVAAFLSRQLPPGQTLKGISISPQILYNPDLKSAHFFVPGLVAVILMMICALLTSITIAREKETGTMEQLLTTPVKPNEVLIGKLLPYVLLAFIDGVLVLVFARIVFGVPFVGSHLLLLGSGLVYVATALSIGILISSLVKTQQLAMMTALVSTLLPSVMLSGFIFAAKNMPLVLQGLNRVIPATYFVKVIRGVMLKGAGLEILLPQVANLVVLMLVFLVIASKRFKTRIG